MNANELADKLDEAADDLEAENIFAWEERAAATMLRQQQEKINNLQQWERRHLDVIKSLEERIERMIENQSHHEGIAHAGGFEQGHEVGRQLGMQQERALWELAASTQEIENERK